MLIELPQQLLELLLPLEYVRIFAFVTISVITIFCLFESRCRFTYVSTKIGKGFLVHATLAFNNVHLLLKLLLIKESGLIGFGWLLAHLREVGDIVCLPWLLI